jgi:HlyD family secretion protein
MNEARNVDVESVTKDGTPSVAESHLPSVAAPMAVVPGGPVYPRAQRRWRRLVLFVLVAGAAAGGGAYWWLHRPPALPAGIAFGNGRVEADPIDIATKFAGRIAQLRVDEGAMVKAGQALAVMDTRDLEAGLKKAEAQVEQANKSIVEAKANVDQLHAQAVLAEQEMVRARELLKNGWITKELFDQRIQQRDGAHANEAAATARVHLAEHMLDAAQHDVELYKVNIADNTLVAPRDGRIEYRVANVGEVLPAGGKVFTMLDVGYVYMDIYLPTLTAGQVKVGSDARIVLDAYPDRPIPARVTFLAAQAQFTPKMVETQSERDKLMFRVRVRIDQAVLSEHADSVRSGLPGVAYVKYDPSVEWPERLRGGRLQGERPPGQR